MVKAQWFEAARMARPRSRLQGILLTLSWLSGLWTASAYVINHSALSLSQKIVARPASAFRSRCFKEPKLRRTLMACRGNANSTHAEGCLLGRRAALSLVLIVRSFYAQHAAAHANERPGTLWQPWDAQHASGPVFHLHVCTHACIISTFVCMCVFGSGLFVCLRVCVLVHAPARIRACVHDEKMNLYQ
jgi:hypothetical protein